MKKRTKFKGFEGEVENDELLPFVGYAVSTHTYTPQSHENLLRSFSMMKARETDTRNYKHENKMLKTELKRLKEEVRKHQEEINLLRSQLANVNLNVGNKSDRVDSRREDGYARETVNGDFSKVVIRNHSTLAGKDRQITSLSQYDMRKRGDPQEVLMSHPSVEAERLRRTHAAIQVFRRDVDLVKTQMEQSPLDQERFPCTSSRERAVVEELTRRQRFGVVADLEAMGKKFFQRLEFEEKLDKLHWELESRRQLQHEECAPTCTYHQEFEMLEITRNNLLKALRDLRAASTLMEPRPALEAPISINTIQTLYKAPIDIVRSHRDVKQTTSELPDK